MTTIQELKAISDALDERDKELSQRERAYIADLALLEDKQKTLKSAWNEFKGLVTKLDTHYDQ